MKRIIFSLGAVLLATGLASAVRADDSTAPATTPSTQATQAAPEATPSAPVKKTTHHAMHHKGATKAMARVDLNNASKEDLMKVPGIDDAIAEKIIAARPFKSRSELETKSIVSKEVYAKIHGHVTVKKAS